MRPITFLCVLALLAWFSGEIMAQPPKHDPGQRRAQGERGPQGPQGQRGRNGPPPQRGRRGRGPNGPGRGGDRGANFRQMLKRMDRNRDGSITKDELPQRMQARFGSMDSNSDGVFDKTEQDAMLERIQKMRRDQNQGDGPPGRQRDRRQGQRNGIDFPQLLKKLDRNRDGTLTKDELPERMQERFDSMDTNGNGLFDEDEQQAVIERMKQRGDKGGKGNRGGNPQDKQGVKPKRPGGDG